MAIPLRQQFSAVLLMMAVAVHFAPELSAELRSIATSGLWLAAILWDSVFAPKVELADSLPRIIWDDRDEGEKFSIVMFHLLLAGFGLFMANQVAVKAIGDDGVLWLIIPAALIAGSTVWFVWTNWSNRNVR
jgi:hypothetical protein